METELIRTDKLSYKIRRFFMNLFMKRNSERVEETFEEKNPKILEIIKIIDEIDEISVNKQLGIIEKEKDIVDLDMELNKDEPTIEIEFNKSNSKQHDLADLIIKYLKIRKKIENVNELKKKYENNN